MKAFQILFSTRTTAILLLLFALSMAVATFVEEIHGTPVAKALIYEATWFEVVMILLIINFIGNINRYRLWRLEKWSVLLLHLSFAFIFLGGAVSRFISFEGIMPIREGETSNQIISEKTFFRVLINDDKWQRNFEDPYILTPFTKHYKKNFDFKDKKVSLRVTQLVPNAKDTVVSSEQGIEMLKIVTTDKGTRKEHFIAKGTVQSIDGLLFSFDKEDPTAIQISQANEGLFVKSPMAGNFLAMATQKQGELPSDQLVPLSLRSLYGIGAFRFVVPDMPFKGIKKFVSAKEKKQKDEYPYSAITVEVRVGNQQKTVEFLGGRGRVDYEKFLSVDGLNLALAYGSKVYTTPFSLRLDKFELDRYPGSSSPSGYASQVTLLDGKRQKRVRIFMNNILDYKGYRFFQASYDPDEKGTRLSVNHDFWGTVISYLGYVLLALGMLFTLFKNQTRFAWLARQLRYLARKKTLGLFFFLSLTFSVWMYAQSAHDDPLKPEAEMQSLKTIENLDSIAQLYKIDKAHAAGFGHLLIQDRSGRFKPMNTMALEITRKIYKSDAIAGMDANQFFLSLLLYPQVWTQAAIIKVSAKGGETLLEQVQATEKGYTAIINLYRMKPKTMALNYVIEEAYNTAFAKSPAKRNEYDKEVINIDERVQILSALFQGRFIKLFPNIGHKDHAWSSWISPENKIDIVGQRLLSDYSQLVAQARKTGNWQKADQWVKEVHVLQRTENQDIIPSESRVSWEVRYNQWNIFYRLMPTYGIIGFFMLVLALSRILLSNMQWDEWLAKGLFLMLTLLFSMHGFGLALRWYISGHAPWSDGYESIIFVSWGTVLSGLIFGQRRSFFIPASTALLATMLLAVAHGSLMSPEITNLVPVLKSYWLMIHVAIIVSSYGFLGLGAFLGLWVLILIILRNKKNAFQIERTIKELTTINEMTLTIGLFMLTIGTFLGGVWANESWGRYWSWDPKETWAFISVMIYAFVLHMRLVPGLKGTYAFNLASLLSISSIVMTYFGVNYYLSGLHSYAKGDPMPVPTWIYWTLGFVTLIAIIAYKRRSFDSNGQKV